MTETKLKSQGVIAASDTVSGVQENATVAELNAAASTVLSVTPDVLAGSEFGLRMVSKEIFDDETAVAVGNGVNPVLVMPSQLTDWLLLDVMARVFTKGITGSCDVQVRRRREAVDADMLSTKITIGDEYYASDGVVDTGNDDLQAGDAVYIDVDAIHSGTAPNGLIITLVLGKG